MTNDFDFDFVLADDVAQLTDSERESLAHLAVCIVGEAPQDHDPLPLAVLRERLAAV